MNVGIRSKVRGALSYTTSHGIASRRRVKQNTIQYNAVLNITLDREVASAGTS